MINEIINQELHELLKAHRPVIRNIVRQALRKEIRFALEEELKIQHSNDPESIPTAPVSTPKEINGSEEKGALYLYAITESQKSHTFGPIGIDGHEVSLINFKNLGAVVHHGPPEPYASSDEAVVRTWLLSHQGVIDAAWNHCKTILPVSFDTLIASSEMESAKEAMEKWLQGSEELYLSKLKSVKDKAEYGVQIFWDTSSMLTRITQEHEEIQTLTQKCQEASRGTGYLMRQKLESLVKKELEKRADLCFRDFFERIKPHVSEIKVEKTKKGEPPSRQMLMNLACLLPQSQSNHLGEVLEDIEKSDGFSVHYTGPWPPYSFAS